MVVYFQLMFVLYAILKPSALIIIVFVDLISSEMGITVKVSTTVFEHFYQSVNEPAVFFSPEPRHCYQSSIVGTKFTCFHGQESHLQGHVIDADAILNLEQNTLRSMRSQPSQF